MIRLLELFGGIGACTKAFERNGIDVEVVDYVEIDKYAVKSYNAIHGTNFEPQDITKWDKEINVDVIMHGSPCQDFSVAGLGKGGDKGSGTRSSLMYETIRIVEKLQPKIVIWENVKNLISKKHKHNFDAYIETMRDLGYESYYKVIDAKDFGIPQNRKRIFTISIREPHSPYVFPQEQPLETRLKDILEKVVDEKFFLSDEQVQKIKFSNFNTNKTRIQTKDYCSTLCARDYKGPPKCVQVAQLYGTTREPNPQAGRIYDANGISPTMDTCSGGNRMPKIVEPFIVASRGRNPENPNDRTPGAPTVQRLEPKLDGTTNTITTVQKDNYVAEPDSETLRVRKLTPLECWRLMGFDDDDFYKAEKVNSNSQLYKQAGNSIVVNVLCAILNNLNEYFVS